LSLAMSSPVKTAMQPGAFSAADVSTFFKVRRCRFAADYSAAWRMPPMAAAPAFTAATML
jgi:hypothetical protein